VEKLFTKKIKNTQISDLNNFLKESYNLKICNAVEDILKYHRDIIVSVKEILLKLKKDYAYTYLNYDELVHIINVDERFEYINIPERFIGNENISEEIIEQQREAIEAMGFFSGSRVKLKTAKIDLTNIVEILNRKVDLMMNVLISIWDKRPRNDPHLEDHLLDILAKAQKMQREIKTVINSDKIKDLTGYLHNDEEN
jgi:hypothetical protein